LKLNCVPDGVELFKRIKAACPMCPVLVLSGYITNDVIVEITRNGFAMFAQKPSVFDSSFFEQLFLALNVPKRNANEFPPATPGEHI
jgi:DNA-binding NtrC family response regulator